MTTMQAEVIAIGDELTSGERLDTNSQWLSQQLGELGVGVMYHTTVGDDLQANVRVFRQAFERADIIVASGGLGPTADDLTRPALALAAGVELALRDDVLAHIRDLFARRGRPMPERNVVQAEFPQGSRVVPKPHGTAPGVDLTVHSPRTARFFALPGVPAEMREMWHQTVQPAIAEMLGQQRRVIRHRCIKCFGVGESDLEQMLPDLIRRGRQPQVGITVSKATITLRITAEAEHEAACQALIVPTVETIRSCLGELVFGEGDDELQHVVIRTLVERGRTLSIVEAGPGGLLSHWLSEVDEHRRAFIGGLVVRQPQVLEGIAREMDLAQDQSPQVQVVARMAQHGRQRFASDYALAVGEFPAADRESERVYFAVATPQGLIWESARFAGHPDILKERCAKQALNLLRLQLV